MRRQPAVDLVVGPQSYHRLAEMEKQVRAGQTALDTDFPEEDKFEHLKARPKAARAPAAFLTVQEGCDKFCAFCVVPYTRGAEVSRPAARVIREARDLVDRGVREITLLGQNVNAYHGAGDGDRAGQDLSLADLIWELNDIAGLERIRFTTSHPNDMQDDLIEAHRSCTKLMPYLHLPVQSGSDHILKRMNRSHTAQSYLELIERIRAARPDIVLSGDFIVGFPEETEADFQATLDLIEKVKYGYAYSFKYSTRPGTPAAERGQIDDKVASERLARIQTLITGHQRDIQNSMVGRDVQVLIEKPGRFEGQMVGKSEYLHAVHIENCTARVGDIVQARVVESKVNSLSAIVGESVSTVA
jgi:tRNA-2-methylthio-N6-dimethylallyladenosine synthase